jgi:hypothetical protein
MLRIVLPVGIPAAIAAPNVVAVAAAAILQLGRAVATTDIRVTVEIVVAINRDVVVATPAAAPTPTAAPERPHHHTDAKRNRHPRGVVAPGRIVNGRVGIDRCAVDDHRIVRGHVDDLRVGLLDHDHSFVLNDLGFYLLLLGRFQIPLVLGFFAHALYGIHYVALLRQKCIPQIRRPLNVVCQTLYHVGQSGHGLYAWIPRLLRDSIGEFFVLQILVLLEPLLELDEFERIRGRGQGLGQQRIGIQRNRCHERVELVRRDLRRFFLCLLRLSRKGRISWQDDC